MSVHRYPTSALLADYGRAGVGVALTGGPVLFLDPAATFGWCLAAVALVFAAFGARTVLRHLTRYEFDDTGLSARGPLPNRVAWNELEAINLRFFSTKRDRKDGWMQLDLKGGGGRIRVDSTLDDFSLIAARAVEAADRRGLPLAEATRGNLAGMGLRPSDAPVEAG